MFRNIGRRKKILEVRIKGLQKRLEVVDFASFSILEHKLQVEYDVVLMRDEML